MQAGRQQALIFLGTYLFLAHHRKVLPTLWRSPPQSVNASWRWTHRPTQIPVWGYTLSWWETKHEARNIVSAYKRQRVNRKSNWALTPQGPPLVIHVLQQFSVSDSFHNLPKYCDQLGTISLNRNLGEHFLFNVTRTYTIAERKQTDIILNKRKPQAFSMYDFIFMLL